MVKNSNTNNTNYSNTQSACQYCRKKKIKCNREKSCNNCSHHNLVCTYSLVNQIKRGPKPKDFIYINNSNSTNSTSNENIEIALTILTLEQYKN
jgi:hypothetical protein